MEKWSIEQYCDRLQAMKCEAHDKLWLYIEVNAKEFMNECEPGVKESERMLQGNAQQDAGGRRVHR